MTDPLFARPGGVVVRVALPVPIDSLFDYSVATSLADGAAPGCRVLVPFSGRKLTGVVVERWSTDAAATRREDTRPSSSAIPTAEPEAAALAPPPSDVPRLGAAASSGAAAFSGAAAASGAAAFSGAAALSEVEQVLDTEPVIDAAFMGLLLETAEQVLCPPGLALAAALPAGSAPRVVRTFELLPRGREALRTGAIHGPARDLLGALELGRVAATRLGRLSSHAPALLEALVADGLVRRTSAVHGPAARVTRVRMAMPAPDLDLDEVCRDALSRAPKQAELLRALAAQGELPSRLLLERTGASPETLRNLVAKGLARIEDREVPRNVLGPPVARDEALPLTPEQAAALEPIREDVRQRRPETFLLHGVTGSGKTEVYLRAVETALEGGRQALVLVPEITLTHQIVARLRARFGDGLAVLHSGLRPSERLEQWQRLRRGDTPIAVGARSALFAPLENLGVIVIDEEHDSAYKNDEGFRYHARGLAERRAALAGCPLILGSATPALETRSRAEQGEIRRLVLERRIGGRPLPAVEVIDLAEERRKAPQGRKLILTRPLRRAIRETLDAHGQTILFLNRRGFSTQIFCFDCGFAERCEACDVALVYHASDHCLRCHYCEFSKPPPEVCGGCGNPDTALLGIGTQRLEEEVRTLYPDAEIVRMDRDTAQRRGYVASVLEGLRRGQTDILIGTQMVAKGHDFPGVRLVGVVAADVGLHMPDFRAAERTFQLLTQVAGRAGRAALPGRVILQSFVPDHYAIRPVRKHDFETFYREELEYRRALGYPPFGAITQVMVSSEQEAQARDAAETLATLARDHAAGSPCEVLGPVPAPLPRLRGRHRFQVLLKSPDRQGVLRTSQQVAFEARRLARGLQVAVDVDPVNML